MGWVGPIDGDAIGDIVGDIVGDSVGDNDGDAVGVASPSMQQLGQSREEKPQLPLTHPTSMAHTEPRSCLGLHVVGSFTLKSSVLIPQYKPSPQSSPKVQGGAGVGDAVGIAPVQPDQEQSLLAH